MVYRPTVEASLCFVLLPLRSPFLGYFEKIIKPAASEAGLIALKADDIYGTRPVMSDIWEHIWKARAVVAIVTDKNPNVNYELGICHALGVPTVLISEKAEDVPFDYRHRRYIPYQTPEAGWEQKLREDITKTLKQVLVTPRDEDELPWPYDTFSVETSGKVGQLIPSEKARDYVIQGADFVSMALAPAFGPSGSRVSVYVQEIARNVALRRGARIAQRIRLGNPLNAQGAQQMARVSEEVLNTNGDLSKTAVFLSVAMLKAADAHLRGGVNQNIFLSGMQRAVETATAYLMTEAQTTTGDQLKGVALSACSFDEQIATTVVDAFRKSGRDGIVQVVDNLGGDLELAVQEGMSLDRGYLSTSFVTNPERQECILEDCYLLIYERPITSMKDLLPLLEQVAKSGIPLLIIAQDVSGEALATLVVNKLRGTLSTAAIKAPSAGAQRTARLQDIAIFTRGKAVLDETARPLDTIELSDLGRAKKVVITKEGTTIIRGAGIASEVDARKKELRTQISMTRNPQELSRLQERLAKLGGAIVMIKAPGRTDEDLADSRYKLESALQSCRSTIENGYVVGGGVCLARAKALVDKLIPKDESEKAGIHAVSHALGAPLRQILENAKCENIESVINEILHAPDTKTGFNARTQSIENLVVAGVLDPAKSLSDALMLAFAFAQGTLRTAAWDTTFSQ